MDVSDQYSTLPVLRVDCNQTPPAISTADVGSSDWSGAQVDLLGLVDPGRETLGEEQVSKHLGTVAQREETAISTYNVTVINNQMYTL